MPRYYFNLKRRDGTLVDPDGLDLPDQAAAREYALQVMSELMRNANVRTRAWRLAVMDQDRQSCFELLFASYDDSGRICRRNFARQLKRLAADTPFSWMQSSTDAQQRCRSEGLWRVPIESPMSQPRMVETVARLLKWRRLWLAGTFSSAASYGASF